MYNNEINTSLGLPHSNNLGCLFHFIRGLVSELPLLLSLSTHLTPKTLTKNTKRRIAWEILKMQS
jgi:hypothetical protein